MRKIAILALISLGICGQGEAQTVSHVSIAGYGARRITKGDDGAVWFSEGGSIGQIKTSDGTLQQYPISGAESEGIVYGPDGNIWFTDLNFGKIGQLNKSTGAITLFSPPTLTLGCYPYSIANGPDGNMWFTEYTCGKIGRITTAGDITEFPLPAGSFPLDIAAGPDGSLWFTETNASGDAIGRITADGSRIFEYQLPPTVDGTSLYPSGIALGPDGALWFTEFFGNKIGRIDTSGSIQEFTVPTPNSSPSFIATGPDGNLWFTEYDGNKIGRLKPTPPYPIDEFSDPAGAKPGGITLGPDDGIWFTESAASLIGKVTLGPGCPTILLLPATLPDGTVNVPYASPTLTPSAGAPPFIFNVSGLPNGMTSTTAPDGLSVSIGGTPLQAFSGTIAVHVGDSNGCPTVQLYSLNIACDAPPLVAITAPSSVCPSTAGYSAAVTPAGPGATYTWGITNGTITSSANSPAVTFASGSAGSVDLSVVVSTGPACSSTASASVSIDPNCKPTITSSNAATLVVSTPTQTFTVTTLSSSAVAFSESGALPNGVQFRDNHDGTATLDGGALDPNASGVYSFKIAATNSNGSVNQDFTLTVEIPPTTIFTAPYGTPDGGIATARLDGGGASCVFTRAAFLDPAGPPDPRLPPSADPALGVTFPKGLLNFATTGCGAGGPVSITLEYLDPSPTLPANTPYWKYGPTPGNPPAWYEFPSSGVSHGLFCSDPDGKPVGCTLVGITIFDGLTGDDDLRVNGNVVDAGGPAIPQATAPSITAQPANQAACAGQSVSFSAAASGSPAPTVQWQLSVNGGASFADIPGATSGTLSFVAAAGDNGKQYRAVFTNSAGSATTSAAVLTVNTAPAITTQPLSPTVGASQSVSFTAAASGSPAPPVQWQVSTDGGVSFSNIPGANTSTLSFTASSAQNGYLYRSVFTNACGSAASNAATLTVTTGCVITINPPALHPATAGRLFIQELSVSSERLVKFSLGAGAPDWLLLKGHMLVGWPLAPGLVTFTVNAVEAKGCTGSRTYTLEIVCPEIVLTPEALPPGILGRSYSRTVEEHGGLGAATFAVTDGALPPGLSLLVPANGAHSDKNRGSAAILSGKPTQLGTYSFTITATDSKGCSASRRYTVTVRAR